MEKYNYNIDRFIEAQDKVFSVVKQELIEGKKEAIGCGTSFLKLKV